MELPFLFFGGERRRPGENLEEDPRSPPLDAAQRFRRSGGTRSKEELCSAASQWNQHWKSCAINGHRILLLHDQSFRSFAVTFPNDTRRTAWFADVFDRVIGSYALG
jgi:hypothetical protein